MTPFVKISYYENVFCCCGSDLSVFTAALVKDLSRTSPESLITQAASSQTVGMTRHASGYNGWVSIWLSLHLFSMHPQIHSEVCLIYKWPASQVRAAHHCSIQTGQMP